MSKLESAVYPEWFQFHLRYLRLLLLFTHVGVLTCHRCGNDSRVAILCRRPFPSVCAQLEGDGGHTGRREVSDPAINNVGAFTIKHDTPFSRTVFVRIANVRVSVGIVV